MSLRRILPTLPLLLMPLLACPVEPADDDDTPADDDDDDDDDVDPCEEPEDITAAVDGGETVSGGTNNENDDFTGSCNETTVGSNDALFVFTPSITGRFLLSTEDPSTDFDTQLYAFTDCANPGGTELGCNDDIDAEAENYASELVIDVVEGEPVYIVIDGYEGVGHYEMSVTPLVCGDGLVAGDEMCDDGNTVAGDGCDADCRWECTDDGGEDDDTPETATEVSPPATVEGVLCPTEMDEEAGYFGDFFMMNLTVGEYGSAEVRPAEGECADLTLGLGIVDAELNLLSTDLTEEGGCPRVALEAPVSGPYYVALIGDDVTVPPQSYVLTVDAGLSECGDGIVEGLEECDDGNLDVDDLCSDTCTINDATCDVVDTVTVGADVTGDTFGSGDDHVGSCFYPGGEGGEDVVYQYDAAADEVVILSTNVAGSDVNTDTVVYVREQCRNPATEIACNDDSNQDNYLSETGFRAEAGSSYWIFVDAWAQDGGVFELDLSLATCGDGVVEPGEDCDDMNQTPGDGCENDCTATPLCVYTADEDLGVLMTGDHTATVDLTASTDTLPALTCSGDGGADAMVRFEVANPGTLSIGATHTGGDVQYRLVADDGACTETVSCTDFGEGVVTGTLSAAVTPGVYHLAMEAFEAGLETTVTLDIVAP